MTRYRNAAAFILLLAVLAACTTASPAAPVPTVTLLPPTVTALPPKTAAPTATAAPIPSTPLSATVWTESPFTVVLTYHQFAANYAEHSTGLKVRFEDFEHQLNQLYDAGFTLVTLEDWLDGKIEVPEGRRPLILSMDDLYFNNQLSLDPETGEPIADCGLGVLWRFSQQHPDFGYSAALFINLGDKLYGDPDDPDWEMQLAEAIAWGIDHDLTPYNHFYSHPRLRKTSPEGILWELEANDHYLSELLTLAGREDLIPGLENFIALTYGVWPAHGEENPMMTYRDMNDSPIRVVAEIDPIYLEKYLPAPFDPEFNPFHLPRHVASPQAVDFLVKQSGKFPAAQVCDLGDVPDMLLDDPAGLAGFVGAAAAQAGCPDGFYVVNGLVLQVGDGKGETLKGAD